MKKGHLLILSLLVIPFGVLAANPKVLTLTGEDKAGTIEYSGTTEEGSHAVMCKLFNEESEQVDLLSTAVDNKSFTGSFKDVKEGKYTLYCANYEGGEITKTEITVSSKTEEVKEETKEETVEKKEEKNPKTNDNIKTYIITLGLSMITLTGTTIYQKKYNN